MEPACLLPIPVCFSTSMPLASIGEDLATYWVTPSFSSHMHLPVTPIQVATYYITTGFIILTANIPSTYSVDRHIYPLAYYAYYCGMTDRGDLPTYDLNALTGLRED